MNNTTTKKKPGRSYTVKHHNPTTTEALVIAIPNKTAKGMTPKPVEVSDEDKKALASYIRAKRAVARHEPVAKELAEKFGKLSFMDAVITPQVHMSYGYEKDLQAEIDAIDERKKAARDSGAAHSYPGALSIRFSDAKKKAAKKK